MTQPPETIHNFRDLGGYTTKDGGTVAHGYIFRSGHLYDTSEKDGEVLASMAVGQVIDFRSEREKQTRPPRWPDSWQPVYCPLPIGGNAAGWIERLFHMLEHSNFPADELREQFLAAFRSIPIDYADGFRQFFSCLIDAKPDTATLIHCTAGKDRTGIASALFLTALGVPRETVMDDFLATNKAVDLEATAKVWAEKISAKSGRTVKPHVIYPLVGVEAEFLNECFQAIEKTAGSMEAYLENYLDLNTARRQQLATRYLG